MWRFILTYQKILLSVCVNLSLAGCTNSNDSHTKAYISENQPSGFRKEFQIVNDQPSYRLSLIGDAGSAGGGNGKAHLQAIAIRAKQTPVEETLLFLGDNIYVHGFQSEDLNCDSEHDNAVRLDALLNVGRVADTPSIIIPGNHDWDETENSYLLHKQKTFIENCGNKARYEPSDGENLKLLSTVGHEHFQLIMLDSQAIINGPESGKREAIAELEKIIEETPPHIPLLLAAHHPISSHGPHGGCYQNDYTGSSIINFLRYLGVGWGQDIKESVYQDYIERLNAVIPTDRDTVYVAGHDHNLQVLKPSQGIDYSLVSGSGSKTSRVCDGEDTLFAQEP